MSHDPLQELESRRLLDASLDDNGILNVTGTPSAERVVLRKRQGEHGPEIEVRVNGDSSTFPLEEVRRIHIDAGEGHDSVESADTINVRTSMLGGPGSDTLRGGAAADQLLGGDGNDSLDGGKRGDTIMGGAGRDTVSYGLRPAPVRVTLDDGDDDDGANESDNVANDIETVIGGSGNDTLTGNGRSNRLIGGFGNDSIVGGRGNDSIDGSEGDDTLFGNLGDDSITSGNGADSIRGGEGNDFLTNFFGTSTIFGDAGNDVLHNFKGAAAELHGGAGDDTVRSIEGLRTDFQGGDGTDVVDVSLLMPGEASITFDDVANDRISLIDSDPENASNMRSDVEDIVP